MAVCRQTDLDEPAGQEDGPGTPCAEMIRSLRSCCHLIPLGAETCYDPTPRGAVPGLQSGLTHPQVQLVVRAVHDLCQAMGEAEPPVVLPTLGGSLPLHDLARALDLPLISMSLANHDDNQHAPHENLRLGHFLQDISTALRAVHGLAQP